MHTHANPKTWSRLRSSLSPEEISEIARDLADQLEREYPDRDAGNIRCSTWRAYETLRFALAATPVAEVVQRLTRSHRE